MALEVNMFHSTPHLMLLTVITHVQQLTLLQETSDALTQRERKVAAERSELDQQRRFQEKQAAHLVSGWETGTASTPNTACGSLS